MKSSISTVLCLALLGLTAGSLRLSPIQAAESTLQPTQVLNTIQQQQQLTRLFPIYENGKIGFIDRTGKITIEPRFDEIFVGFSEGLAPVRIGKKWGFIDQTGKIAIEPRFDRGFDFSEGLAAVAINRRLGYINKTGKIVIPVEFEDVYRFSEGLARVKVQGKWGFIDRKGQIAIRPQFDSARSFSNSIARIERNLPNKLPGLPFGAIGAIDKTGKIIVEPKFYQSWRYSEFIAPPFFAEGLEPVTLSDKPDEKYGYINTTGEFAISPQFDRAEIFKEGLAKITLNGRDGFIDTTGKIIIPPQFNASSFSEGLVRVSQPTGEEGETCSNGWRSLPHSHWGFINKTGKIAIPLMFDWADDFSEGMAQVRFGKGCSPSKYGFIDKTGRQVIAPHFDEVRKFSGGLAYARIGNRWGYIDKIGMFVWSTRLINSQ